MSTSPLAAAVTGWYAANARDLPWRAPEATAWGILVSEVMLQQTPVARVQPVWEAWMERWPTATDLAEASPGDAIRAWGRLGYPRRALRLHAAATTIASTYAGEVPADYEDLLSLPGIGEYTAAAVASFAFGDRRAVLDTNVRRVLARAVGGQQAPPPSLTKAERDRAVALLPDDEAPLWAVAVMELGALVCTAAAPACDRCPLRSDCAWLAAGAPVDHQAVRRTQPWIGTDRMVRGKLMARVREAPGSVPQAALDLVWPEPVQRERALAGLIEDGLLVVEDGWFALPGPATPSR